MPRQAYKLLEDFIIPALDEKTYGHLLEWENEQEVKPSTSRAEAVQIATETEAKFRIAWMHKAKSSWSLRDLRVFLDWDALKNRYPPPGAISEGRPPTGSIYDKFLVNSKQRLRSALRNIRYVDELECIGDYKRYVIRELQTARQGRQQDHKLEDKKIAIQRRHEPLDPPSSPEVPHTSTSKPHDGSKTRTRRKTKVKQEKVKQELCTDDEDVEDKDDPTYYPQASRSRSSSRRRRNTRMFIKQEVGEFEFLTGEELPSLFSEVSLNPSEVGEIPRTSIPVPETPRTPEAGLFASASEETPAIGPPKIRLLRELACLLGDQAKSSWSTAAEPKRRSKVSQNSWADSFEEKQRALKEKLIQVKEEPVPWRTIAMSMNSGPSSSRQLSEVDPSSFRQLSEVGPSSSRQLSEAGPSSSRQLSEVDPSSSRQLSEAGPSSSRQLSEAVQVSKKKTSLRTRPSITHQAAASDLTKSFMQSVTSALVRFSTFEYGTTEESEEEVEVFQGAEPGQSTALNSNEYKGIASRKKKPSRRNKKRDGSIDQYDTNLLPKRKPDDIQPSKSNFYSAPSTSRLLSVFESDLPPLRGATAGQSCTSQAENAQEADAKRKGKGRKRNVPIAKDVSLNLLNRTSVIPDVLEYQAQAEKEHGARSKSHTPSASNSTCSRETVENKESEEHEDEKFSIMLKTDNFFGYCANFFTQQLLDGSTLLEQIEANQYYLDHTPHIYNGDEYYE